MKKTLRRLIALGGAAGLALAMAGCLTTARSEAIKADTASGAKANLASAADEVAAILAKKLGEDAAADFGAVEAEYRATRKAVLEASPGAAGEGRLDALEEKRDGKLDTLRRTYLGRAEGYTWEIQKIRNGAKAIDSLVEMQRYETQATRDLLIEVVTKTIPAALAEAKAGGKIDPKLLAAIEKYLGVAGPILTGAEE